MPPKHNKKGWSMFPELDHEVSDLLDVHGLHFDFHKPDDSRNCLKEYDTNVMGRFECENGSCSKEGWSSNRIAVTIRMYAGREYNARVYHQRCRGCKHLSRPSLDGSYADRVVYRLRKCLG
ncbi:hypothetical protein E4U41_005628 [Claviceps citrina]|nr:hypothetical protein E4U41_005628 [Claviceps citrina]